MSASNSSLLILRPGTANVQVQRAVVCEDAGSQDEYVFPLWWILVGRLIGAQIIHRNLEVCAVDDIRILGVASRRSLGAPAFAYLLLLVLGIFTLSIPVRVRFSLRVLHRMDLPSIREYIKGQIHKNRSAKGVEEVKRIEEKISRANSFDTLVSVFASD